MRPLHLLLLLVAAAVAPPAAGAQQIAFHGIAWDLPGDSVRSLLQAQGFAFRRELEHGDHEFTREDGTLLRAEMRAGRLIGFTMIDPLRGEGEAGRYRALADSFQAAFGAPAEVVEEPRPERVWVAGLTSVRIETYVYAGDSLVEAAWRGPGWYDEMARRGERGPQPVGFTIVDVGHFMQIAVDTTVRGPHTAGSMRGRFRIEYFQPVTPSVEGVPQDPLDAVVYEMDFDCANRRARLVSRTTYLEGRQTSSNQPRNQAWAAPQRDGHYDRGLNAVCRAARGR
jgi:hypothetical protein